MASGPAPPVIKIGPPPAGGGKQPPAYTAFVQKWSKKYPGLRQWAPQILAYAKEVHIDPVYFASVILTESGANANTKSSRAGAIGLGQIMPLHVGESVPWDQTGRTKVTLADLHNPIFNLRWSAHYLARAVGNYGYQNAYSQGYNPGYTGPDPTARIPKGYLPGVSTPGTSGAPGVGTPTGAAANPSKDPWVVITAKGGLKTVSSVSPPKNAVHDGTGAAYTLSQFNQVRNSLDSIYLAYTGNKTSYKAVVAYIRNPVSDYEITQRLSNPSTNPRFYKSPIWLTHAPDYQSVYQSVYGNDANTNTKEARALITYGVTHNLSQAGFQEILRKQPNYSTSEEYKGAAAQFQGAYQQIYGTPDATGKQHIDMAVRQGWNADQWTQYLRSQPEYTASGEFQKNVYNLFNQLGFGSNQPGVTPAPPGASFGPVAPTPTPSLTATGS